MELIQVEGRDVWWVGGSASQGCKIARHSALATTRQSRATSPTLALHPPGIRVSKCCLNTSGQWPASELSLWKNFSVHFEQITKTAFSVPFHQKKQILSMQIISMNVTYIGRISFYEDTKVLYKYSSYSKQQRYLCPWRSSKAIWSIRKIWN